MFRTRTNWMQAGRTIAAIALLLGFVWAPRTAVHADQKKKKAAPAAEDSKPKAVDYSNIVWPNPPAIPRIRYQAWYASDRVQRNMKGNVSKKSGWMDRLAGTQTEQEVYKLPFSLWSRMDRRWTRRATFTSPIRRLGRFSYSIQIREQWN